MFLLYICITWTECLRTLELPVRDYVAKCLEDRGQRVLMVWPVSPLIMTIKCAKNCVKSGTAGFCCGWFPLSPLCSSISIFTSDDISGCFHLGPKWPSWGPALLVVSTTLSSGGNGLWAVMLLQPWRWLLKIQAPITMMLVNETTSGSGTCVPTPLEPKRRPCSVF